MADTDVNQPTLQACDCCGVPDELSRNAFFSNPVCRCCMTTWLEEWTEDMTVAALGEMSRRRRDRGELTD